MASFTTKLLLLGALGWGVQGAAAQTGPFFEHPDALRHGYAAELLGLHLELAAAGAPGAEGGLAEQAVLLLAGSLGAHDPELLRALEAALSELGADEATRASAAAEARGVLAEVRTALIPEALGRDPAFQAALLSLLATLEPGVAEAYEEAAQGEPDAYTLAWTGLQRLEAMWTTLEPTLTSRAGTADVARAFGTLDALIAEPAPPERYRDPEDAEGAVQDLVFGLEAATGTPILPRDLRAVADLVQSQAEAGCAAAARQHVRLALEHTGAAAFYFTSYLSDTLTVLAPDAEAHVSKLLAASAAAPTGAATHSGQGCETLVSALQALRGTLGG